ncbi:MAG: HU family DNA-binding protein [Paracoccus sp. (in: a-proteobacteria)]|uniref:HU family DNA-binding protein n=1 Tax=Paracoccus sp. TaxID=267 RepID=UPI0026DF40CF|nr:HU family DNA-binding protein [Paracoccus sp. (in: a-proteobacteria)]MDO5622583.1 HU family DNA-binding protein [Paracoccus sp. (in: a-proteobacteria)]
MNTKATAKTAPKNAAKAVAPKAAKAAPRARKAKPEVSDPIPAKIVQKREFLDRVVAASGAKKNDARVIVEATLAELGKAFAAGESLAVQPFGKARVNRQKDVGGGEVLILRLRRKADSADA